MLKFKVFLVTSSSFHVVVYTSGGFQLICNIYIAHQMSYPP